MALLSITGRCSAISILSFPSRGEKKQIHSPTTERSRKLQEFQRRNRIVLIRPLTKIPGVDEGCFRDRKPSKHLPNIKEGEIQFSSLLTTYPLIDKT